VRTVIAGFADYSLDGFIGEAGSPFYDFCRSVPDDPAHQAWEGEALAAAEVLILGRLSYQAMAGYFPHATDNPFADTMNRVRKVVFSRTLEHADWQNTTIARGDLTEEIDALRAGGDGVIAAAGGMSFVRALTRADLVDEYRLSMYPYLAGSGTTLSDVPRALDLVSSTAFGNGVIGLSYRRGTSAA
jgi:dihydrofolate reductase